MISKPSASDLRTELPVRIERLCWVIVVLATVLAFCIVDALRKNGASEPVPGFKNVFHVLFCKYEVSALVFLYLPLLLGFGMRWLPERVKGDWFQIRTIWILGLVLAVTASGTCWVTRGFPLPVDEYFAVLQHQIFCHGEWFRWSFPPDCREYLDAMAAPQLVVDHARVSLAPPTLPGFALIWSFFELFSAGPYANVLISGGVVLALASVARKLFPESRTAVPVALLLLISSPQFLLYGMTSYAMQAHLLFGLVWLRLFICEDRAAQTAAPWVGVLAMMLHRPNIHLLLAAPFLWRLVRDKKWGTVVYTALVYALGIALIKVWAVMRTPGGADGIGHESYSPEAILHGIFSVPGPRQIMNQLMSLIMLLNWNNLLLLPLFWAGFRSKKEDAGGVFGDLWWGVILTTLFYLFINFDQGHGWGGRYFHPVLGSLLLLAVRTWVVCEQDFPNSIPGLSRILVASVLAGLFINLPFRLVEAHTLTEPFARAEEKLRSQPARVVVLSISRLWYGDDLVRNPARDPGKLILLRENLSADQIEKLRGRNDTVILDEKDFPYLPPAFPR
jgi:hypothetical protein